MNRHKQWVYVPGFEKPQHITTGYVTGWVFTDSTLNVKCGKCRSDKGFLCETPKGEKAKYPHKERTSAFVALASR